MRNPLALLILALILGLTGCASLPTDVEREVSSHTDRDGDPSHLAATASSVLPKHPGESGFWLLGNGHDAFAARILLAEAAQRSIDVQYYLYHNDLTGRLLTHALLRAADRGVRVRLLLDDMATKGIDAHLAALDSHANFEVRILNPYANRGFRAFESLARFDTVTRRMHNKSFSVDKVLTIVGGRNVGDEYYNAAEEVNFGDMDVLALGPAAVEVGGQFDLYWNNALAYPIDSLARNSGDLDQLRRDLAEYADEQRDSPYAERVRTSRLVQDIEEGGAGFQMGTGSGLLRLAGKADHGPGGPLHPPGPQGAARYAGKAGPGPANLQPLLHSRRRGCQAADGPGEAGHSGPGGYQLPGVDGRGARARGLRQVPRAAAAGRGGDL